MSGYVGPRKGMDPRREEGNSIKKLVDIGGNLTSVLGNSGPSESMGMRARFKLTKLEVGKERKQRGSCTRRR